MHRMLVYLLTVVILTSPVMAEDEPGLKAGVKAPDFEALTHKGETVRLSEINNQGPVVLVFYRGGWCMYCNRQLKALNDRLDDFNVLNAQIVAISVDLQSNAAKTVEEKELGFIVISDPGADLLKSYNLVYKIPDDLAETYKSKYNIDLQAYSGRDDNVIAVPATYVIDRTGMITFAYANRDYKVRKSPDELLDALRSVN